MYISKNIIDAHRGKIWSDNISKEKGAIFSFTLPLDQRFLQNNGSRQILCCCHYFIFNRSGKFGVPENEDRQNCEYTVPDHCLEPYVKSGYMFNGTQIQGNDLSCYEIKPLSDFRVTIDDISRHHLDSNYDGIACEYNDN